MRAAKTLSLLELMARFPDEASAEKWLVEQRWPDGVVCPKCGCDRIHHRRNRKPSPYRCRDCRCGHSTAAVHSLGQADHPSRRRRAARSSDWGEDRRWIWGHASIFPRGCDKAAHAQGGNKMLDIERVFCKHVYG